MLYIKNMIDIIVNYMSWIWLGILILCCVIEAFTMALTTIWAGLAAIPMIFIARTDLPVKWQLLIFAVITVVLIFTTRPFAIKKLHVGKDKTNVNTMIGEEVLVTKTVSKFQKGEAKAKNGVIWTVVSQSDEDISKGTVVKVIEVNGNTLIVAK